MDKNTKIDNYNDKSVKIEKYDNYNDLKDLARTIEDLQGTMKILANLIKRVAELRDDYYKSKRLLTKVISMMILMFLSNTILLICLIIDLEIIDPVVIIVLIVIWLFTLLNTIFILDDKLKNK